MLNASTSTSSIVGIPSWLGIFSVLLKKEKRIIIHCNLMINASFSLSQMGDQDVYERLSGSQTDGEMGDEKGESEGESEKRGSWTGTESFYQFSSSLRAVVRIRQKYQTMKKRRLELAGLGGVGPVVGAGLFTGAPVRASPKIFTFEGLTPSSATTTLSLLLQKKKKKRSRRVMFPSGGGCRAPLVKERSRAKNCLFLLCTILFLQVMCMCVRLIFIFVFLFVCLCLILYFIPPSLHTGV